MNMTKAWIVAVTVSALVVGAVAVALVTSGGGSSRRATPAQVSAPSPTAPAAVAPTDPAGAATALQVQQVLAGVISRLQAPAADGSTKAVTPAEIDAQVHAELAKIGLNR